MANAKPRFNPRKYDIDAYDALVKSGVSKAMARVMSSRGITDVSSLDYNLRNALGVNKLTNADKMAKLIADKMEAGKRFLVVADYDSDGATSCAILVRAMRGFGANIEYMVPNRFEHGYGLTPDIVKIAAAMTPRPDSIITVDNGIASIDGVAEANKLGISVLVTDHHLPAEQTPEAECIVNPNQRGCTFPSKNLAGCGVIFYVMLAVKHELQQRGWFNTHPNFNVTDLLDFVALGTVADVVKLDDNNRKLVSAGLKQMREGKAHEGIQALLHVAKRDPNKANPWDMGFGVGPRLNAAGRLDDMSVGISCLLEDDPFKASTLAEQLNTLNIERRAIESDMTVQAVQQLEGTEFNTDDKYSMTLFHPDWHQGVIGILASRIKEKTNRPVIAFGRGSNGELKGSGRSIPPLPLRDALDMVYKQNPNLIKKFGGHSMAAGLTIMEDDLAKFTVAFEEACRHMMAPEDLELVVDTDGSLSPDEINLELAEAIKNQVWGQGFPEPVFQGEFTVENQKIVGEKHSKLRLLQGNRIYDAILFHHTDPVPNTIKAVYSLDVNEWQGSRMLQLRIQNFDAAEKPQYVHNPVFEQTESGLAL